METINTFAVSFFIRNDRADSEGRQPIFIRITINRERVNFSTQRKIDPKRWNNAGKVLDNRKDAKELNNFLDSLRTRMYNIRTELINNGEVPTAQKLKKIYLGNSDNQKTLLEVYNYHNEKVKELVGKDFSPTTYKRYATAMHRVKEFIEYKFHTKDHLLSKLDREFISDFEYYLKVKRKCEHNTSANYIKNLKKVVNLAINNDWIQKNPFFNYRIPIREVRREFLTNEELLTIEQKEINIERLAVVRDAFVFSCYTGLAYIDIAGLTPDHIMIGIDGGYWIMSYRTKTGTKTNIPILPKALEILERYKNHPVALLKNQVIPISSNQKMNAYLKELATICGIRKNITYHIARHTFATTVTLTNGVPIESVSQMLGHTSIKTTQIYAKVVDKKVSEDMGKLRVQLLNAGEKQKIVTDL